MAWPRMNLRSTQPLAGREGCPDPLPLLFGVVLLTGTSTDLSSLAHRTITVLDCKAVSTTLEVPMDVDTGPHFTAEVQKVKPPA